MATSNYDDQADVPLLNVLAPATMNVQSAPVAQDPAEMYVQTVNTRPREKRLIHARTRRTAAAVLLPPPPHDRFCVCAARRAAPT